MTDIKTIQLSETAPAGNANAVMASQDGDTLTIFQTEDGDFGWCIHGISNGLGYETDDVAGFDTAEEAEEDARRHYAESK